MNIFREAARLQEEGTAFAAATIIESRGSTPRNTGKMLVLKDRSIIGTVGGGLAEAYIIDEAVDAISKDCSRVVEYKLDKEAAGGIQMLCGGTLKVFIEVIGTRPEIVMIGAGHVGQAVGKLCGFLDFRLVVVDDREEFANEQKYPLAKQLAYDKDIIKAIDKISITDNSYIIIATKDSDLSSLKRVIASDAAYIGMIGSRKKVSRVFEELICSGISKERLGFIHAPVGLNIGAETPEEIAVSILAEILKVRNGRDGLSLKEAGG